MSLNVNVKRHCDSRIWSLGAPFAVAVHDSVACCQYAQYCTPLHPDLGIPPMYEIKNIILYNILPETRLTVTVHGAFPPGGAETKRCHSDT